MLHIPRARQGEQAYPSIRRVDSPRGQAARPTAWPIRATVPSRCHRPAIPHAPPHRPPRAPPLGLPANHAVLPAPRPPRLLDQVPARTRALHHSKRTEAACVHRARAHIRFSGLRHPRDLGPDDVPSFLQWLASERRVAAATQQQTLSAPVFLYRRVLPLDLRWWAKLGGGAVRSALGNLPTP